MAQTYRITVLESPPYCDERWRIVIATPQNPLRLVGNKRDVWQDAVRKHARRISDATGCDPRAVVVTDHVEEY